MTALPQDGERRSWTVGVRERTARLVPAGQILPDRQPAYVASWIYVFGVLTICRPGRGHRLGPGAGAGRGAAGGTPQSSATS